MPSSELSRCYAKYPPKVGSRESLLLGMPKLAVSYELRAKNLPTGQASKNLFIVCAQVVEKLWQRLGVFAQPGFGRVEGVYNLRIYPQFVLGFLATSPTIISRFLYQLNGLFYQLYTPTITKTTYIKLNNY